MNFKVLNRLSVRLLIIIYLTYTGNLSSKNHSFQDSSKFRKYEIEKGTIRYKAYEIVNKKEKAAFQFDVTFTNYGCEEVISFYSKDSVRFYYKNEDLQTNNHAGKEEKAIRGWNVFPELLAQDNSFKLYKGVQLEKKLLVKYKKMDCVKFCHFQFEKYPFVGSVIYYEKIPVVIVINYYNKIYLIKAEDFNWN